MTPEMSGYLGLSDRLQEAAERVGSKQLSTARLSQQYFRWVDSRRGLQRQWIAED